MYRGVLKYVDDRNWEVSENKCVSCTYYCLARREEKTKKLFKVYHSHTKCLFFKIYVDSGNTICINFQVCWCIIL